MSHELFRLEMAVYATQDSWTVVSLWLITLMSGMTYTQMFYYIHVKLYISAIDPVLELHEL